MHSSCQHQHSGVRRVRSDQFHPTDQPTRVASFISDHRAPCPRPPRTRQTSPSCEIRESCPPPTVIRSTNPQGNLRSNVSCCHQKYEPLEYPIEEWDTADSSNDDWEVCPYPIEAASSRHRDHGTVRFMETPGDVDRRYQHGSGMEGSYYPQYAPMQQQRQKYPPQYRQMSRNNSNRPRPNRSRMAKSGSSRNRSRPGEARHGSPTRSMQRGESSRTSRSKARNGGDLISSLWQTHGKGAVWIWLFGAFVVVMGIAWYEGRYEAKAQQVGWPW